MVFEKLRPAPQIALSKRTDNIQTSFMIQPAQKLFNPCSLDDDGEQIPAKIWELLRRNRVFRDLVQQLSKLDSKERSDCEKTGAYHGSAWQKSWQLVRHVEAHHPFAGVALKWLVPEPLFQCSIATWPRGKKWKEHPVFIHRYLQVGEGVTPNVKDKDWVWRDPNRPDVGGHPIRRGPEVHWQMSRFKRLRSWVNPILEWRRYLWPFTVEHSWPDAPAQFRRAFHFIWRRQFDCRPTNPLTNDRRDSPTPHEIYFFHDWNLMNFRASGHLTQDDWYQRTRFNALAADYRVFAIPKTILTKASADAMGKWLADELKKGSDLYGNLLKGKLLNEGELLGTTPEWADWLARNAKQTSGAAKDSHFYRRCRYMDTLVTLIYPAFDIARLFAPPRHRARGKKYILKGGQK